MLGDDLAKFRDEFGFAALFAFSAVTGFFLGIPVEFGELFEHAAFATAIHDGYSVEPDSRERVWLL